MNYREQTGVGTSWMRTYRVTFSNEAARSVWFDEQFVFVGPDGAKTITTAMGMGCGMELTELNAETTFPLLDETGEPSGASATYREVYTLMMSLYYHVAAVRDAGGGNV